MKRYRAVERNNTEDRVKDQKRSVFLHWCIASFAATLHSATPRLGPHYWQKNLHHHTVI